MQNKEIVEGILCLLQGTSPEGDGCGYTIKQIQNFLKENGITIDNLYGFLENFEKKGLVEKRFLGGLEGRIDFSIEQKGIDLIEELRKKSKIKLEDKWKIK